MNNLLLIFLFSLTFTTVVVQSNGEFLIGQPGQSSGCGHGQIDPLFNGLENTGIFDRFDYSIAGCTEKKKKQKKEKKKEKKEE